MLNKLLLTITILVSSCSDSRQNRKDFVKDKLIKINENIYEWENLTKDILNDTFVNIHLGKLIITSELNNNIRQRLEKFGVTQISVEKKTNCTEVEYTTNWAESPIGKLYLTKNTCDNIQTKRGYYFDNYDTNFIEVWGVGNNWLIWIDSDLL